MKIARAPFRPSLLASLLGTLVLASSRAWTREGRPAQCAALLGTPPILVVAGGVDVGVLPVTLPIGGFALDGDDD